VTVVAVRREARRMLRGPLVAGVMMLYALLLAYGGVQSVRHVRSLRAQVSAAAEDQASRWASLRAAARGPRTTWSDGRSASLVGGPVGFGVATMPVDRLAGLSVGESTRVAPTRRVSIYAGDDEPPLENPLAAAGGRFDLAFVVTWLLPLALIVAGHGAVSGDRQDGIWSLVLSTGASPVAVAGRRLLVPAVMLLAMTLAGGVASVAANGAPPGANETVRLAAWASAVVLYTVIWLGLTALATMGAPASATALLALGLFWLTAVWAVPAAVDAGALLAHPPPNRWAGQLTARDATRDLDARLPAMLETVYAEHPEWRPSDAEVAAARKPVPGGPASGDARRVYVPARIAAAEDAVHRAALRTWRVAVEAVVNRAGLLSPALLVQRVGDDVSGLSASRFAAFDARVDDLERGWHAFFAPRIMRLADLTGADLATAPLPEPGGVALPPSSVLSGALLALAAWATGVGVLVGRARPWLHR